MLQIILLLLLSPLLADAHPSRHQQLTSLRHHHHRHHHHLRWRGPQRIIDDDGLTWNFTTKYVRDSSKKLNKDDDEIGASGRLIPAWVRLKDQEDVRRTKRTYLLCLGQCAQCVMRYHKGVYLGGRCARTCRSKKWLASVDRKCQDPTFFDI